MKEMNGGVPFLYLQPCGCVFSQAGLKAMGASPTAIEETETPLPEHQKAYVLSAAQVRPCG